MELQLNQSRGEPAAMSVVDIAKALHARGEMTPAQSKQIKPLESRLEKSGHKLAAGQLETGKVLLEAHNILYGGNKENSRVWGNWLRDKVMSQLLPGISRDQIDRLIEMASVMSALPKAINDAFVANGITFTTSAQALFGALDGAVKRIEQETDLSPKTCHSAEDAEHFVALLKQFKKEELQAKREAKKPKSAAADTAEEEAEQQSTKPQPQAASTTEEEVVDEQPPTSSTAAAQPRASEDVVEEVEAEAPTTPATTSATEEVIEDVANVNYDPLVRARAEINRMVDLVRKLADRFGDVLSAPEADYQAYHDAEQWQLLDAEMTKLTNLWHDIQPSAKKQPSKAA